jgi:hypothetical protein
MEKNCFLEKLLRIFKNFSFALSAFVLISFSSCKEEVKLKVAISPYQDIAMIVNKDNLKLEEKYKTELDLITMNWEEILPAVSSAGETVDIGFGSLTEFLTKYENINKSTNDPVLFIYPAYIYKGGGFLSFNKNVPIITKENVSNDSIVRQFLSFKIGAQKNSIYEMILFSLANRHNIPFKQLKIYDTPMNDGFLASQGNNPSIDITSAGLTQITEGYKYNGRLVLEMENVGFADITGFICKQSTLNAKREQIENFIKMWFDCVDFVFQDLDANSKYSLKYLDEKAATKYTLDQYKTALSQEYFPKTLIESENSIISDSGLYSYKRISADIIEYLFTNSIVKNKPPVPDFIEIKH